MLALEEQQNVEAQQSIDASHSDGMMVLGQELQDPYKLSNMQQAYANITGAKAQLQPTHRYMRFLPKNDDEYDALKHCGLELFDYPLHYEIAQSGTHYHDPELPAEAITWQYVVVPMSVVIPEEIKHELLYEVFIPADGAKSDLFAALEDEAMRLSGYADELLAANGAKGKWSAYGTIRVWDDALGQYIPLEGAKVRARRLTHVERGFTNSEGYYNAGSFRYAANYDIIWEASHYDIRDGRIGQAKYDGPKQSSSWSKDIGTGEGKQLMFATIHRAAYKMFYGNNLGMTRPQLAAGKSTKIACMDEYDTEKAGLYQSNFNALGVFPNIKVWTRTETGGFRKTYQVFETTAHELGHQAHARLMNSVQFVQVSINVVESWATAVGWAITNSEYEYWGSRLGIVNILQKYPLNSELLSGVYRHNKWPNIGNTAYSPLFIDLIDDNNQGANGNNKPNDQVSGYTMQFLNERILPNSYGLGSLQTELKSNLISGVTTEQIDLLFELYHNL